MFCLVARDQCNRVIMRRLSSIDVGSPHFKELERLTVVIYNKASLSSSDLKNIPPSQGKKRYPNLLPFNISYLDFKSRLNILH